MEKSELKPLVDIVMKNNGLFGIFANPYFGTTSLMMKLVNEINKEKEGVSIIVSLDLLENHWKQRMLSMRLSIENIVILDDSCITIEAIESTIIEFQQINVIVIDYLGLMDKVVAEQIKNVSKKYALPIVVLGKLSRDSGDYDPRHRPELYSVSDLCRRKKIELMEYDYLALLHREHDCERGIGVANRYNISDMCELIIKRNCFGDIGSLFIRHEIEKWEN